MAESDFKKRFRKRVERRFPGCFILKNDAEFVQGIPDMIILFEDRWAILEFKDHKNSAYQPNQKYYIAQLNEMSYAAVVYPENIEEVWHDLQLALQPGR